MGTRRTVGDRDGLPVEVLGEMLRWPAVERVWLPTWLATPTASSSGWSTVAAQAERRVPDDGGLPASAEPSSPAPRRAAMDEPSPRAEEPVTPLFAAAAPASPPGPI